MRPSVSLLFTCIVMVSTIAQKLPDPFLINVRPPNPFIDPDSVNGPLIRPIKDGLPPPSQARSMAARAVSGIDSLTREIQSTMKFITGFDDRIKALNSKLSSLNEEKISSIRDLKAGYYCSLCRGTKTQFEKKGENFLAHVKEVNGTVVAATSQEIAEAERKFDAEGRQIEKEIRDCRTSRDEMAADAKIAKSELEQGIGIWRTASSFELDLIASHSQLAAARATNDGKAASDNLRKIERDQNLALAKSPSDLAGVSQLEPSRKMWSGVLRGIEQAEAKRAMDQQRNLVQAQEKRFAEYRDIVTFLERLDLDTYKASTIFGVAPKVSVSMDRVSFSLSENELKTSLKLGSYASANLEASNQRGVFETKAVLELAGRIRVAAGWRTSAGPDGIQTGPTSSFDVLPPNDKEVKEISPLINVQSSPATKRRLILPDPTESVESHSTGLGSTKVGYHWFDIGPGPVYPFDPDEPESRNRALAEALRGIEKYKSTKSPVERRGSALPAK
jgi:hypothetical protein